MISMDDNKIRRAFGAFIRAGRKRRGLTQMEVSTALGVTQSVYTSYETGRRPISFPTALNICKYLELDINDFVMSLSRKKPTILPLDNIKQ